MSDIASYAGKSGTSRLSVGAAKVDITPYDRVVNMAGFGFSRRSTGVLDPLYARAIYVSDGAEWTVLVGVDVIGLFNDYVNSVRDLLSGDFANSDRILICSTHNHDGPDTMGYWGRALLGKLPVSTGVDEEYMAALRSRLVDVIRAARADAEPVRMFRGSAEAPRFLTENVREPGYKDDTLSFLRFDRADGSRKAYLLNYACHPESLWSENTKISSDYVGVLCRLIEEETGAAPVFLSGALGGMVTQNLEESAPMPDRIRFMNAMGGSLYGCLRRAEAAAVEVPEPAVRHARRSITVPLENSMLLLLHRLGVFKREGGGKTVRTEANMVKIGDVAIFGAPGEPLPSLGFQIKGRLSGSPMSMVVGLCCDELGYILSHEDCKRRQYEFEKSMSAGESLTTEVLRSVYDLLAEFKSGDDGV
jgi:hypothetical protein